MTRILIISDIFGRTRSLDRLARGLALPGTYVEILDPYKGVDQKFTSQQQAYDAFMAHVGLESYREIIIGKTGSCRGPLFLIAFSVGASAVWQISGDPAFQYVSKASCFYPSQIRHFPGVVPCFDLELIFPSSEPGFDVDEMIATQTEKPHVTCKKEKGKHGFMNALSPGYDENLYKNNRLHLAEKIENEMQCIRKTGKL